MKSQKAAAQGANGANAARADGHEQRFIKRNWQPRDVNKVHTACGAASKYNAKTQTAKVEGAVGVSDPQAADPTLNIYNTRSSKKTWA